MINFIGRKKIFFIASAAVILLGIIAFFTFGGLNLDLDFQGGTAIRMEIGQEFDDAAIKSMVEEITGTTVQVQKSGTDSTEVYVKTLELGAETRDAVVEAIKAEYSLEQDALLEANNVSASASSKLISDAFKAIAWAVAFMLIYISFRFSIKSGLSAIFGLLHNILVMLAIYVIFRIPVNSSFVAAVLTIVGYSINDTIVVFDKIRENAKKERRTQFAEVANKSINQTLGRTVNTSVTTLVTIVMLYIMGVDSIKEFALPIIIGILVGTYSSICISAPMWTIIDGISFGRRKLKKA